MSVDLTIRSARDADVPALTDLILRSKKTNGYDDAFMAACADELAMTPAKIAQLRVLVAERDVPQGCVALDITCSKIESFFIGPDAQRQGVGRALWQAILTEAQQAGLSHLTLDADPAATAFYEAMGFEIIGQTPSGSIPGRFLPLMRLDL